MWDEEDENIDWSRIDDGIKQRKEELTFAGVEGTGGRIVKGVEAMDSLRYATYWRPPAETDSQETELVERLAKAEEEVAFFKNLNKEYYEKNQRLHEDYEDLRGRVQKQSIALEALEMSMADQLTGKQCRSIQDAAQGIEIRWYVDGMAPIQVVSTPEPKRSKYKSGPVDNGY